MFLNEFFAHNFLNKIYEQFFWNNFLKHLFWPTFWNNFFGQLLSIFVWNFYKLSFLNKLLAQIFNYAFLKHFRHIFLFELSISIFYSMAYFQQILIFRLFFVVKLRTGPQNLFDATVPNFFCFKKRLKKRFKTFLSDGIFLKREKYRNFSKKKK